MEKIEDKDIELHIDRETLLQEYIPRKDYEQRLKADMVAMLTDIQLEIEESESCGKAFHLGLHMASDIITKKINALKSCNDCISNNGNTCNVCHDKDMYKEK